MSTEPDGLEEFEGSALLRSLRSPGTTEELADEARFRAAYRQSRSGPGRGRVIGRIGAGGAALLVAVTFTGGVAAAAYTQHLPRSVQTIAHGALGGIGVPPAPTPAPVTAPPQRPSASLVPAPTPSADRTEQPPAADARRPGRPDGQPSSGATSTGSPATEGVSTPSAPPEATEPLAPSGTPVPGLPATEPGTPSPVAPIVPTAVSATPSVRRVSVGGRASVTGLVVTGRTPVVGARVRLLQRSVAGRWTRVASAVTGQDGTATFATHALAENTFFRVRAAVDTDGDGDADRSLRSQRTRIGVRPLLRLRTDGGVLSLHAIGAAPGDAVTVSRRTADGRLVRLGIRQLDSRSRATYDLSSLSGRVRIVVRLLRTSTHTAAQRRTTVRRPPAPAPPTEPTEPPGPTEPAPTEPDEEPSGAEPAGTPGRSTTSGS